MPVNRNINKNDVMEYLRSNPGMAYYYALTKKELEVFEFISRNQPLTVRQISEALQMVPQHVYEIVWSLENKEFVTRTTIRSKTNKPILQYRVRKGDDYE